MGYRILAVLGLLAGLLGGVAQAGGNGIKGDSNCDAFVDVLDAQHILQFEAEYISAMRCPANADVTGGGAITPVDALLILQYDVGLIEDFS